MFCGGKVEASIKSRDHNALSLKIPEQKHAIADDWYLGEPTKIVCSNCNQSKVFKENMNHACSCQDALFSRHFWYGISTEYLLKFHKTYTQAVCVIVLFGMQNGQKSMEM